VPAVEFTCQIVDRRHDDRFSAKVVVKKKPVVRATWKDEAGARKSPVKNRIELADVFITPVSGQVMNVHHHFVVYDFYGRGVYVLRNRLNQREDRCECSVWDLGHAFATKVMDALRGMP